MGSDHDIKGNAALTRAFIDHHDGPPFAKQSRIKCDRDCWLKEAFSSLDSGEQHVAAYTAPKSRHWEESELRECARKLYRPLHSWQTRIIELHPGKGADELRCTLLVVDLIAHPGVGIPARSLTTEYVALSYAWGKPADTATIECSGVEFGISPTLHEALWHTRSLETPCHIWCDALVINQRDMDEKAIQVEKMLLIFEKAHHIIAWLGSLSAPLARLFDATNSSSSGHSTGSGVKDIRRRFNVKTHDKECITHLDELKADMKSLVTRPWFHRLWIRQEVFAASYLDFKWGPKSLGYQHLIQWLDDANPKWRTDATFQTLDILSNDAAHAEMLDLDYNTSKRGSSKRHQMDQDYDPERKMPYVLHWLQNLHKGSYFGATDDRDRIFGLLGMIQSPSAQSHVSTIPNPVRVASSNYNEPQSGFDIDYRHSITHVYGILIKRIMRQTLSLTPLLVFEDRRHRASDLPSWVVDWRQCHARHFEHNSQVPNTHIKVIALAEGSCKSLKQSRWIYRPDRLILEGMQVHMGLINKIVLSDKDMSDLHKLEYPITSLIPRRYFPKQIKRQAQAVATMRELVHTGAYVFRKVLMRGDHKRVMALVPENAAIDDIMV